MRPGFLLYVMEPKGLKVSRARHQTALHRRFGRLRARFPTRWPLPAHFTQGDSLYSSRLLGNGKSLPPEVSFRIWGAELLTKGGVICQQRNGGAVSSGCAAGLTECGVCLVGHRYLLWQIKFARRDYMNAKSCTSGMVATETTRVTTVMPVAYSPSLLFMEAIMGTTVMMGKLMMATMDTIMS